MRSPSISKGPPGEPEAKVPLQGVPAGLLPLLGLLQGAESRGSRGGPPKDHGTEAGGTLRPHERKDQGGEQQEAGRPSLPLQVKCTHTNYRTLNPITLREVLIGLSGAFKIGQLIA